MNTDNTERLKNLALLDPITYDQQRADVAKELNIRVSTVDALVDEHRTSSSQQGEDTDELVEGVEPWDKPVDCADLADQMVKVISRHCVLSNHTINAAALWIISSYAIDSFRIYPRLAVTSPQKRCGKTTFLETISAMCNRALPGSNLSSSVLFRVIEEFQPTLIIDEMDTFIEGNEELRGIINSGHTRKLANVFRVEGDSSSRAPRRFSTWAPCVLAKIGSFPDTIADRSISVMLERKLEGDVVSKPPVNLDDRCLTIRRKCQRWANDHKNRLSASEPESPNVNNDRAEDNWHPLLAVADIIGGEWPEKARLAMVAIEKDNTSDDSEDISIALLKDIQSLIEKYRWEKVVHSKKLIELLNDMEERPWPTLRSDKGLSAHVLAKMLKPFGLRSGAKRNKVTGENLKGYDIEKLNNVFSRYLTPKNTIQSVTTSQVNSHAGSSAFQNVTENELVTDGEWLKAYNHAGCDFVTDKTSFSGGMDEKGYSSDGNLYPEGWGNKSAIGGAK